MIKKGLLDSSLQIHHRFQLRKLVNFDTFYLFSVERSRFDRLSFQKSKFYWISSLQERCKFSILSLNLLDALSR